VKALKPWVKETLISVFILFHLVCLIYAATPSSGYLWRVISLPLQHYVNMTGLWQAWGMFAPDPRSFQCYLDAEIRYADGTQKIWEFPRMEKLSQWQRFRMERYRKWVNDNLRDENQKILWDDAARFVARRNNAIPGNPPVTITLIRHWKMPTPLVPPPSSVSGNTCIYTGGNTPRNA